VSTISHRLWFGIEARQDATIEGIGSSIPRSLRSRCPPALAGLRTLILTRHLDLFPGKPRERGFHQASRMTLPAPCRFDNSLGNDVEHYFWLARVVECLAGSIKSFDHGRKRLGVKLPRRYQGTN
jgi:hypothetical protein